MRYFLEVSYDGTNYSGFQVQKNANTIQAEVERALFIFCRQKISLTGSSRTDAGVHALQNFFHFDTEIILEKPAIYNLNSILPPDIAIKSLVRVAAEAHSRFDALSREYHYHVYTAKDPFLINRGWFYPYPLNINKLNEAATLVGKQSEFVSFSKRNSQVITTSCTISKSIWVQTNEGVKYEVKANRFLRGMVRALVATMLKVGRDKVSINEFETLLTKTDSEGVDFSAPSSGLFLVAVEYPKSIFTK